MNELVSIIIPCYKQAQYLPDALDSILSQTYTHWECVVVNDASPDNTLEVANHYAKIDNRISVLNLEKNGGLANARNNGIMATNGKYIVPLDADDRLHATFIERVFAVYTSMPPVKVVYTDTWHFGDDLSYAKRDDIDMKELCLRNFFQPTAFFSRRDFENTAGYRKNIFGYEDWDLWLQLIDTPGDAIRIPEGLFYTRVKRESMITELTGNESLERKVREQIYLYNRKKIQKYFPSLALSYERKFAQKDWSFIVSYKLERSIKKLTGTAE